MASRIARSALGATRARPTVPIRSLPALPISASVRHNSNVPQEDPKKKAQSIIDSLPGNSYVSKTAILSATAGLGVFGVSNEFLVINEETVVAFCLLSIFWAVGKYGGPMYRDWADGQIEKMKGIFQAARKDHRAAVESRIDDVKQLGSVIEVTKSLFEVSKETATLESQAFELEQRTAIVAEAKSVLDSWVRYENQVKQRQQKELSDTVINKVRKELENPKLLQQILNQSVTDIEKIVATKSQ